MTARPNRRRKRPDKAGRARPGARRGRRLEAAAQAYRDGRLAEAAAMCRDIAARADAGPARPEAAQAWHLLGLVAWRGGDLTGAAEAFGRAAALDPGAAEAHNNLGAVLQAQGRHEAAAASFRRALELDPDYADALNNLGVAAQWLERHDEALDAFRRLLALRPGDPDAHSNLGVALKDRGDTAGALACFDRALALDPDSAEVHNNRGLALQAAGRFAEAAAGYERALARRPDHAPALRNLASVRKVRPGDPVVARIEARLRSGDLPAAARAQLGLALAKCYDDLGDHDRAFAQARVANRIKREREPFDLAAYRRETDALIAAFDATFFAARPGWGDPSERPVFIVGMPRSGTTLVEQVLASHPAVFGAGELPAVNRIAAGLPARLGEAAGYPACAARLDAATARTLAGAYLARLDGRAGAAARVTDKMPGNLRHLGLIALLFPRARVVHCRRDPLDTCLSCYFQDFRRQPFTNDLRDLGGVYRDNERLMAHWRAVLPLPAFEVRYEDMVADLEGVARRLLAFCGLDWHADCAAFHRTERAVVTASLWQARQPLYATSVARWRRYERHLAPLRRALAGEA